jgi:hypothetical protein
MLSMQGRRKCNGRIIINCLPPKLRSSLSVGRPLQIKNYTPRTGRLQAALEKRRQAVAMTKQIHER